MKIGDLVSYVAAAGGTYPATVTAVKKHDVLTLLDLEVQVTAKSRLPLRNIPLRYAPEPHERAIARPLVKVA